MIEENTELEIWTISVKLANCKITIELDSETTLDDLARNILDIFEFDDDHMSEFFIARTPGYSNRDAVFSTPSPFSNNSFEDKYSTVNYSLKDLYPMKKNKYLYFHFDFGDNWYFKILKSRKKPKAREEGVVYPKVIKIEGDLPAQYDYWDE